MHTKDFLAQELDKAGLPEMAAKARDGYYHDFLSPLAMPCQQLAADLLEVGTVAALSLRQRHINGEFDANTEESEEWAKSMEGRRAKDTPDAFEQELHTVCAAAIEARGQKEGSEG